MFTRRYHLQEIVTYDILPLVRDNKYNVRPRSDTNGISLIRCFPGTEVHGLLRELIQTGFHKGVRNNYLYDIVYTVFD